MAQAQAGSEDFDFAGGSISTDNEDFDWASLDGSDTAGPVKQAVTTAKAAERADAANQSVVAIKTGLIPFRDATSAGTAAADCDPTPTAASVASAIMVPLTGSQPSRAAAGAAAVLAQQPRVQVEQQTPDSSSLSIPGTTALSAPPLRPTTLSPKHSIILKPNEAAASAGIQQIGVMPKGPAKPPATASGQIAVQQQTTNSPTGTTGNSQAAVGRYPVSPAAACGSGPSGIMRQPAKGTASVHQSAAIQAPPSATKQQGAEGNAPQQQTTSTAVAATTTANQATVPQATFNAVIAPSLTASSGGGSKVHDGGVWGGGWGLGGLSSRLQQVALGAAKDLQELTASVQQVVAEVVAADDVSEAEHLSEYQAQYQAQHNAPSTTADPAAAAAAPPAAITATRDSRGHLAGMNETAATIPPGSIGSISSNKRNSSARHPVEAATSAASTSQHQNVQQLGDNPEEAKRLEVLQRLQGTDTQVESGLKAIDDQVDQLAASAAKALGSLWGGFSSVAKTGWNVGAVITTKVEAAAKEVAKELAVGLEEGVQVVAPLTGLREAAGHLAARAEKGLETVGRGAISLLDPQFNKSFLSEGLAQDWDSSFDSCFELYGGSQAREELEQLSSDCAHICNRARAKLQQEHREQIDSTLAKLMPAFDLGNPQQPAAAASPQKAGSSSQSATAAGAFDVNDSMQEAFEQLYLPVTALCNKGRYKASQLQEEATQAAASALGAQDTTDTAQGRAAHTAADNSVANAAASEAEIEPEGVEQPGKDSSSNSSSNRTSKVEQVLGRVLQNLKSAAIKSQAEVSAGQLMLLLALGRSVAAVPRYGKPLGDGLMWPADPDKVAAIVRQQTHHMLDDIKALSETFSSATSSILDILHKAVASAAGGGAVGSSDGDGHHTRLVLARQAEAVAAEVNLSCNTAMGHVMDGFGQLLYVVLLSSLHRAGLQQQQRRSALH